MKIHELNTIKSGKGATDVLRCYGNRKRMCGVEVEVEEGVCHVPACVAQKMCHPAGREKV